jgi:hypothetical protein
MKLPLTIQLRISRHLLTLLVLAHGVAIGAILPLMLPWPWRLALLGLVVISLAHCLLGQYRQPFASLHLGAQGDLEIETKVGARETAAIMPQTSVMSNMIILCLRQGAVRTLTVALLPDAVGATAFRQLSLWLKWRARLA